MDDFYLYENDKIVFKILESDKVDLNKSDFKIGVEHLLDEVEKIQTCFDLSSTRILPFQIEPNYI